MYRESSPSKHRRDKSVAGAPRYCRLSSSSRGHSSNTCLTDKTTPHLGQAGRSAPQSRYPWVPWVCPVRILHRITSSLLLFREEECQRDNLGFKVKSLFPWDCSHASCHFFPTREEIVGYKSLAGRGKRRVQALRAARLAAASASSLPLIPTWLGIQHSVICFPARFKIVRRCKTSQTRG